jgi:hypothetical protein
VVECEQGYRASHAYPKHIYVPEGRGRRRGQRVADFVTALAAYAVPVEPLGTAPTEATPKHLQTALTRLRETRTS